MFDIFILILFDCASLCSGIMAIGMAGSLSSASVTLLGPPVCLPFLVPYQFNSAPSLIHALIGPITNPHMALYFQNKQQF